MDPKLEEEIIARNPLLYRQRNYPMTQTCMCWGLCVGDGWAPIISELSKDLTVLLKKQFAELKEDEQLCMSCGHHKDAHFGSKTYSPGKCLDVRKFPRKDIFFPYAAYRKKNLIKWIYLGWYYLRRMALFIYNYFYYDLRSCYCEKYDPPIGVAVQVKEKFGSLRFYMHNSTEEMEELISKAEEETSKTCEACGKPGTERSGGWIFTLCDGCWEKKKKERLGETVA